MNKEDRMTAFEMRCDGKTWAQIAALLNYDETTVRDDLYSVITRQTHYAHIIYPALAGHITRHYMGSIERFAVYMQVSPHRLRRVLVHGDAPSEALIEKVLRATGMTREEAFFVGLDL